LLILKKMAWEIETDWGAVRGQGAIKVDAVVAGSPKLGGWLAGKRERAGGPSTRGKRGHKIYWQTTRRGNKWGGTLATTGRQWGKIAAGRFELILLMNWASQGVDKVNRPKVQTGRGVEALGREAAVDQ